MPPRRERAIVLGAGLAGLLTARVLSEFFAEVVLVERDRLPDGPVPRKGVPQGHHTHALLSRGREVLEELLPGLTADLVERGAQTGDLQAEVRMYNDGHLLRRGPSDLRGIGLTRPLLEDQVRDRVRALPSISVLDRVEVLEPVRAGDRVTGVRLRPRAEGADAVTLPADLVVDATGRGSHTPMWLQEQGLPRPAETAIDLGVRYTTWVFPRRPEDLDGDRGLLIGPTARAPRFGVAVLVEGDRWMVTAGGYRGDRAPTDLAAFRQYVTGLPAPDLAHLVADLEPAEEPRAYRFQSSVRRHYERLDRFPRAFLVIGDALSSFNPIYGQGMTVAALEALALRDELAEDVAEHPRRFFRRAARIIDTPWDVAAGADLRIPAVPGRRTIRVRLVNPYVAGVQAAAATDPDVGRAFLRVINMLDGPEALLRPAVVARVLAANLRTARRGAAGSSRRPGIPLPRRTTEDRPPAVPGSASGRNVPPVGIEPTLGPF